MLIGSSFSAFMKLAREESLLVRNIKESILTTMDYT